MANRKSKYCFDKVQCGVRLKELREKKKLTLEEFADKLAPIVYKDYGESDKYNNELAVISRCELGTTLIKTPMVAAYAKLCGTTCDYIINGTEDDLVPKLTLEDIEEKTGLDARSVRFLQHYVKDHCKEMGEDDEQCRLIEKEAYSFINALLADTMFLALVGKTIFEVRNMSRNKYPDELSPKEVRKRVKWQEDEIKFKISTLGQTFATTVTEYCKNLKHPNHKGLFKIAMKDVWNKK